MLGANLPSQGLVVIAVAVFVAGIVTFVLANAMPARTMPGAMIRAMLAAYRRTLERTMAQARSMQQVVDEARLAWLDSPDLAIVWAVALGLQKPVEDVLERSIDDLRAGRVAPGTYLPAWYGTGSGGAAGGWAGGGVGGGGLFSSSAVPNFGGMMAVLGTIGNSPASSGGGGFGGGGGGGAGGGF